MKLLLIDNSSDILAELQTLATRAGYKVTTVSHRDVARIKLNGWDTVLLSGGILHNNENEYIAAYRDEMELIRTAQVPVVGVCLGLHLMAMAYAGLVPLMKEPQHGPRQINITPAGQKLLSLPPSITVFKNHTNAVQDVPTEFEVLGQSPTHAEIIRHPTRPLVGVQFHPEIQVPGVDSVAMLGRLIEIARANAVHPETTAELA